MDIEDHGIVSWSIDLKLLQAVKTNRDIIFPTEIMAMILRSAVTCPIKLSKLIREGHLRRNVLKEDKSLV